MTLIFSGVGGGVVSRTFSWIGAGSSGFVADGFGVAVGVAVVAGFGVGAAVDAGFGVGVAVVVGLAVVGAFVGGFVVVVVVVVGGGGVVVVVVVGFCAFTSGAAWFAFALLYDFGSLTRPIYLLEYDPKYK